MNKYYKMIKIVDSCFAILCIFLFCFLWSKFFIKNIFFACLASSIICIAIILLYRFLFNIKNDKKLLTKKQQEQIEKIKNFYMYNSYKKVQQEFIKQLGAYFIGENCVTIKGKLFYVALQEQEISKDTCFNLLKQNIYSSELNIICCEINSQAQDFCSTLDNVQVNFYNAKRMLVDYNFNVDSVQNEIKIKQKNKLTLKDFGQLIVKSDNFKGYFLSACVLTVSTFFVRYKIYYYVAISILLILAVICKTLPKVKDAKIDKSSN